MAKRRVILVNPRTCDRENIRLPLSVLALAAVLGDRYDYDVVDGNVDPDATGAVLRTLAGGPCALVGLTVMPGPQVGPSIQISSAVRAAHPEVPIAWGGYFPTLYANAAVNAPYVDYAVRGQGEATLLDLLERLPDVGPPGPSASGLSASPLREVRGLTWKDDGRIVHNPERPFRPPDEFPALPYHRLGDVRQYLRPTFLGSRTGVHQAAIGCRYRCTFCGVVSMFNGHTRLPGTGRLREALTTLRDRYGATAIQFFDHNFFDHEGTSVPVLEELASAGMDWWCYARADTLAGFSTATWELIRRSRLRMAYIGAEAASDEALKRMRKGTRVEHTLEVAARCKAYGVIPEFSFVLGGPEDPEGDIDRTLTFIRRLKRLHPRCEVVLYFYSPTPQRDPASVRRAGLDEARLPVLTTYGPSGPPLPTTPEEWTEPRWVSYVCHQDAPWLSPDLRRRVADFATVLGCRFPTVQDVKTPRWGRVVLRELARWRYAAGRYRNPWELRWALERIPLRQPERDSL